MAEQAEHAEHSVVKKPRLRAGLLGLPPDALHLIVGISSLKDVSAISRTNSAWREYVRDDNELWRAIARCQFPHLVSLRASLPRAVPFLSLVQRQVAFSKRPSCHNILTSDALRAFTFSFVPAGGGEALTFAAPELFQGGGAVSVPDHIARSIFVQ